MSLTINEGRLVDLLTANGLDRYSVVGFVLSLKTDDNISLMIDFLETNENVSLDDIWRKFYDIRGIDMPELENEE